MYKVLAIILIAVVLVFGLSDPFTFTELALIALCVFLFLKVAALIAGIHWIWVHGEQACHELQGIEEVRGGDEASFLLEIYDRFRRLPARYALFGVNDVHWRRYAEPVMREDEASTLKVLVGECLAWLRFVLFRFETLVLWSVLILAFRDNSGPQTLERADRLALAACTLLMSLLYLMGAEILVGTALLGRRYSRFFHILFRRHQPNDSKGRFLVWQLLNFLRLLVAAVASVSAILLTYCVCFGGFIGIEHATHDQSAMARLQLFAEFVAFSVTTVSTVGYGDVHPSTVGSRLLVSGVQFLAMTYLLYLLQVLLSGTVSPDD